jgi:hypothetical protein
MKNSVVSFSTFLESIVFSEPIQLNTKLGPRLFKKASMTVLSLQIFRENLKFFETNFKKLGIEVRYNRSGAALWWKSREDLSFHEIVSAELYTENELADQISEIFKIDSQFIEKVPKTDFLYAKEPIKINETFEKMEKRTFCILQPASFLIHKSRTINADNLSIDGEILTGLISKGDFLYTLDESKKTASFQVKSIDKNGEAVDEIISGNVTLEIITSDGTLNSNEVIGNYKALEEAKKRALFKALQTNIEDSKAHLKLEIRRLKESLKYNLNALLKRGSFREFEELVAAVFKAKGFIVSLTPPTRDGGKDIICRKDGKTYYIECKLFTGDTIVTRPMVQKLVGVCAIDGAFGILVSTGSFSDDAIEFAHRAGIEIWDGNKTAAVVLSAFPDQNPILYSSKCPECRQFVYFNLFDNEFDKACPNGHSVKRAIYWNDPILS